MSHSLEWKKVLVHNIKETENLELLAILIQSKNNLIIVSDGSKSETKSGGA